MEINLPLTIKIIHAPESSDAPWVAYCPELDISSCGPSPEKAKAMLNQAMEIVLADAKKRGTLNEYLESVGFSIKRKTITLPKISYEPFYFPISKFLEKKLVCPA